ncbi:MAG: nitronate monooxygenase [Deltaproteobacteria bacterium]|nr:nitronate monooxygenase [Deltaproteobacteria bacterium]MBW2398868.1 nitronate monooxygenase [Deltaproteobacteria bacterium]MBW2667061.1 nitronate monooxygenase [Deltaproteobacteria bacterium]
MAFRTALCDMLEIEVPVFLAGMGGVAFAPLCAAVSEAGGFGTLGMAAASPDAIRDEMRAVRELTSAPFGVDLLTALPQTLEQSAQVIIDEGAKVFIAGLGVPGPVIEKFHAADVKVFSMCGTVRHAVAAVEAGCDAVVAQGGEAGGHTGRVAALALIPQIVDAVDVPVLAAGSIVDGRGVAAALTLGAQGVWIGTRFIATPEARAAVEYKDAIVRAGSSDTLITRCYSGKPMRVVKNDYAESFRTREDEIALFPQQAAFSFEAGVMNFMLDSYSEMDTASSCMPAGQGCGGINEILPAAEVIRRLVGDAQEALEHAAHAFNPRGD